MILWKVRVVREGYYVLTHNKLCVNTNLLTLLKYSEQNTILSQSADPLHPRNFFPGKPFFQIKSPWI